MKRQHLRKLLIIISMLLFPITLYYFSPALIINAGLAGIINGSFIVFLLLFLFSIPFGRLFCAYLCPGGGLQECTFAVNQKNPKQGWRNYIKYVIWTLWIGAVIFCYFHTGKIVDVDFFFATDGGFSVTTFQSYMIYYGIILLIFIPAICFGKRAFCHYLCWMAPFMVLGTKLRQILHLPGLHIKAEKEGCTDCHRCNQICPMGLDVASMAKEGRINSTECIQCGACIDQCKPKVLGYAMMNKKEGRGKKKSPMV